jgi:hypothetical protein
MVVAGVLFWITSMTMHKFIMKYPQIKDICQFRPFHNNKLSSPQVTQPNSDKNR